MNKTTKKRKRKYSTRAKPSIKTPGEGLGYLIKLASLVPPQVELPLLFNSARTNTTEELTKAIAELPAGTQALQAHLLLLMNQPEEWPLDYRVMYRQTAGSSVNKLLLERTKQACQSNAVRSRYGLIRNANEALRSIAAQNVTGSFVEILVPTELLIRMDKRTGKSVALYDPIYAALLGEELNNLKICPRCQQLFFAPQVNSRACKKCREAYRKKKQRNAKAG